jgi:hypothetical protein
MVFFQTKMTVINIFIHISTTVISKIDKPKTKTA